MGGESRYQVKFPSNHFLINQLYFSTVNVKLSLTYYFITGFSDANSSFSYY